MFKYVLRRVITVLILFVDRNLLLNQQEFEEYSLGQIENALSKLRYEYRTP